MHMKTKNGNDNETLNKGLIMELECDQQLKEEIINCLIENRSDNRLHSGNVALQCENRPQTDKFLKQ